MRSNSEIVERVQAMFSSRSRATWIFVEPLSYSAVSSLVSMTLHRDKEECASLSTFVHTTSSGNPFSARNILTTLQRQHYVRYSRSDPGHTLCSHHPTRLLLTGSAIIGSTSIISFVSLYTQQWPRYDMQAIEGSLMNRAISDPTDLTFLRSHMRGLPDEARKYLTWAAFFGET